MRNTYGNSLASQTNRREIDWVPTLFLTLTPLTALVGCTLYYSFNEFAWTHALVFSVFYYLTTLAITAGYHRLFAHKSYQATTPIKVFYLIFGAAAFQNSALKWSADHRRHHRFVDGKPDPYSIKEGFWHAHVLWMFWKETLPMDPTTVRDLMADKWVMWQHRNYLWLAILSCFGLPTLIGGLFGAPLMGLLVGGFARLVVAHHFTFFINSLAHMWGSQPYTDKNSAKDNPVLAFFTNGEGYHNFHHLFAADYRNGIKWYHWDPTKWWILALKWSGFASQLRQTPHRLILKAKMKMQEQQVQTKYAHVYEQWASKLSQLREQVDTHQKNLRSLHARYEQVKTQRMAQSKQTMLELRAEIRRTRRQWRQAWQEWNWALSAMARSAAT